MNERVDSFSVTSSPTAVTLSREGADGMGGSIRIPLAEIDFVCELLRQVKQAIGYSPPPPEPEPERPIPVPLSVPEEQMAEWASEPDLLPPDAASENEEAAPEAVVVPEA